MLKLKKVSWPAVEWDAKEALMRWSSKEEENVVRESKSWFPASLRLWFIWFSFLFIAKNQAKHTAPLLIVLNQGFWANRVVLMFADNCLSAHKLSPQCAKCGKLWKFNSKAINRWQYLWAERLQSNWEYRQLELTVGLASILSGEENKHSTGNTDIWAFWDQPHPHCHQITSLPKYIHTNIFIYIWWVLFHIKKFLWNIFHAGGFNFLLSC